MLLRLEGVTFDYSTANGHAVENLNLEIASGTATAILGPNGAGKTTLLYLILGWLRPLKGRIWLDGRLLEGYTRRELGRRMSLVPQREHIPFEYSLLEYVLLGRAPHLPPLAMPGEADIQVAFSALERVGLGKMSHRSILTLSGGERQLVMIARALAQEPRLLLLDEPTSHLDLKNKHRVISLLRHLRAQGATLLLTTHDPEVVSALATDVILMRNGHVLKAGPFQEIFTGPSLSYLYQLPVEVVEVMGRRVAIVPSG